MAQDVVSIISGSAVLPKLVAPGQGCCASVYRIFQRQHKKSQRPTSLRTSCDRICHLVRAKRSARAGRYRAGPHSRLYRGPVDPARRLPRSSSIWLRSACCSIRFVVGQVIAVNPESPVHQCRTHKNPHKVKNLVGIVAFQDVLLRFLAFTPLL